MATREGSIRVTLRSGAFQSGLRKMQGQVSAAGRKMGASLSKPMAAGFSSARKSISGMNKDLMNSVKMGLSFGGAIGGAALVKDALNIQGIFRNIAINVSKLPDVTMKWQEVQELVNASAEKTGQTASSMALAFDGVFKATGDLEYSKQVLESIGVAATHSGKSAEEFANVAGMLTRKWGASGDAVGESMARIIEKIDIGGAGLADLTSGFDAMAGNAAAAGLGGEEGLSKLLGIIKILDNKMGAESIMAMKTFFENFKEGSALVKEFEKKAKVKFDFNMDAFDQLASIMESDKGMAVATEKFTGPIGVMFDELSMPFKIAVKESRAAGLSAKAAREKGIEAFKKSMADASKSSAKYADLQKVVADRMKDDPSVKLNLALDKIRVAFAQPKMLNAIDTVAEKLPIMAEKLVQFINWMVDNPWKAAASVGGAKIGLDMAGAGIGAGGTMIGKKIAKKFAPAAAGAAGAAGAGATTAAGAGTAGTLAAGSAVGVGAAAMAAGAAGAMVGYGLHKLVLDPQAEKAFAKLEESSNATITAMNALQGNNVATKYKALQSLQNKAKDLPSSMMSMEAGMGMIASLFTDVKSPFELMKESAAENAKQQKALVESIMTQVKSMNKSAENADKFAENLNKAGKALNKLVPRSPTGDAVGPKNLPVVDGQTFKAG